MAKLRSHQTVGSFTGPGEYNNLEFIFQITTAQQLSQGTAPSVEHHH